MSRRTRDVSYDPSSYVTDLRQAITRYLPRSGLALVSDDRKLRWVPRMLVTCAILTSWDVADLLTDAFGRARGVVAAMYPSRRRPGGTYAGFAKTLARRGESHLAVVAPRLRRHVRRLALRCGRWRSGTRPAFGVDGSKVECPMTAANEAAFGTCGKAKTGPQQFLTALFHVGTGLIWDFRRGDARASERAHLLAMLATLPVDAILLADAGFVGYDFFRAILGADDEPTDAGRRRRRRGRTFLIRVGANVRLLTKLGWCYREHDGIVYLWPGEARKKKEPPLVLRLITLVDGRNRRTHLLTAVLDRDELSDAEAGELYRKRWGVEVIYRSLKQTMGKRKLRSASPANAAAELDWAVVGLWLLGLMGVEQVVDAGGVPDDWSVAAGLRVARGAMELPPSRDRRRRRPSLGAMLAAGIKDRYTRSRPKTARHWPHKKKDKPPGDPKARMASDAEIKLAAKLRKKRAAA